MAMACWRGTALRVDRPQIASGAGFTELAWWAAALFPNESEETAAVLDEAGRWLKARDPQRANEFYRALVLRCPKTSRGLAAAQRRWFPDVETKE